MRLLGVLVGFFLMAFGLALVVFALQSYASENWYVPAGDSTWFVPALACLAFLVGLFLVLSAEFLERAR